MEFKLTERLYLTVGVTEELDGDLEPEKKIKIGLILSELFNFLSKQ